ncbi:MAG: DUF2975 domain-containing protein [Bifidobacteriaceae bacterium]|jgi:hypothetical protein|nr:DUF2975 domain-containing protein [Bifidobacteriaceae bacterium]
MRIGSRVALAWIFEGIMWASIGVQALGGIVSPLVGLAHQGDPPGTPGDMIRVTGGSNRLVLPLTGEGIQAVYGEGAATPPSGTAHVGDVYLTPTTTAELTLARTGIAEIIATVGTTILGSVVLISAFTILIRIVRTIRRGDPFEPRNITRFYGLAFTLIGGWILVTAVHAAAIAAVASSADLAPFVSWAPDISLTPFFVGLSVMVLAVVFQQGMRLRADTEGLV